MSDRASAEMTVVELERWLAGSTFEMTKPAFASLGGDPQEGRVTIILPDCPTCGRRLHRRGADEAAVVINASAQTVTFHPCDHVIAVRDMPEEWRP